MLGTDGGAPPPAGAADSRETWVVALVVVGFLCGLYGQVVYRMGVQWYGDPDASHGFVVPAIVGYLVWQSRAQWLALAPRPRAAGVALLGFGLFLLIVGSLGAELFLQRSSLVVVASGLVLLLLGRAHLALLAFPLAYLLFMVPLPAIVVNAVAFPLQLLAARTATACLTVFRVPVLREGNVINLAGTTLEVAEACSGIRSLQALLALGAIYGYLTQRQNWKRWALLLLSIPIAIAANVFRVSGTGLLSHYWGREAAEGFYHSLSGWAVFVVAFVLLFACGAVLSRVDRPAATASEDR